MLNEIEFDVVVYFAAEQDRLQSIEHFSVAQDEISKLWLVGVRIERQTEYTTDRRVEWTQMHLFEVVDAFAGRAALVLGVEIEFEIV